MACIGAQILSEAARVVRNQVICRIQNMAMRAVVLL